MRKIICISIILLSAISFRVEAQYKNNKHYYSPKSYDYHYSDRYNPGLCGMASLAVPGLGQIIAGESHRGVAILCAAAGTYILTYSGVMIMEGASSVYSSDYSTGAYIFLGGFLSMLTVDIYAIVDAVRVAKVNNLVIRDLEKASFILKPTLTTSLTGKYNPGIALTFNF